MIDTILSKAHDNMRKSIEVTKNDLQTVRSGRATPSLVEHIVITAYEGTQHLRLLEMATITTSDTRTIVISPFDPSTREDIIKSIQAVSSGLTPVSDGEIIRITIPAMSEEQRQEYLKLARVKLESGRIMVRQVRQDAMKELKRMKEEITIAEDQLKIGEKKIQELTDEMIAEIDNMGERKEQELLQI